MDSVKYLVGYYVKSNEIDNTEYTWYEFNKIEDAPEKIGELKKGIKTYMVFDGKIRNDYLNYSELDINVNIKYFYNNEKGRGGRIDDLDQRGAHLVTGDAGQIVTDHLALGLALLVTGVHCNKQSRVTVHKLDSSFYSTECSFPERCNTLISSG